MEKYIKKIALILAMLMVITIMCSCQANIEAADNTRKIGFELLQNPNSSEDNPRYINYTLEYNGTKKDNSILTLKFTGTSDGNNFRMNIVDESNGIIKTYRDVLFSSNGKLYTNMDALLNIFEDTDVFVSTEPEKYFGKYAESQGVEEIKEIVHEITDALREMSLLKEGTLSDSVYSFEYLKEETNEAFAKIKALNIKEEKLLDIISGIDGSSEVDFETELKSETVNKKQTESAETTPVTDPYIDTDYADQIEEPIEIKRNDYKNLLLKVLEVLNIEESINTNSLTEKMTLSNNGLKKFVYVLEFCNKSEDGQTREVKTKFRLELTEQKGSFETIDPDTRNIESANAISNAIYEELFNIRNNNFENHTMPDSTHIENNSLILDYYGDAADIEYVFTFEKEKPKYCNITIITKDESIHKLLREHFKGDDYEIEDDNIDPVVEGKGKGKLKIKITSFYAFENDFAKCTCPEEMYDYIAEHGFTF